MFSSSLRRLTDHWHKRYGVVIMSVVEARGAYWQVPWTPKPLNAIDIAPPNLFSQALGIRFLSGVLATLTIMVNFSACFARLK